jgi:hypothetical protein
MVFEKFFYNASCPPVPPSNPTELASEAGKLMASAGIRSCEQSSSVQTAEVQAKMKILFASASVGAKMTNTKTSSIGCEQVVSITNKYRESKNNVSCMLKSTKNVTRTSASGVNSIIFKAGRDAIISCPKLKIDQKMKITLISNFNLSQAELSVIEKNSKDVAKEVIKAVQDSKNGLGATPQGGKFLMDSTKDINETNYSANISETLNEITTSVTGKNELLFEAGRDLRISGDDCQISQDMVIDLIAASVIDSTISDMLSNISERIEEKDTELQQKSEAAGADKLDDFGDVEAGENEARKYLYIAIAVVGAIILIGGIIYFVVSKKSSPPASYLKGRSFSPSYSPKQTIDNRVLGVFLILALLYFSSKKEGFKTEDEVYSGF